MGRLLVNAGCGPIGARLPAVFDDWQELRVDVDPAVKPNIVASITDLSAIPSRSADAVWSAHCIEHLFAHDVSRALAEFHRILADDGFACVIVPDLQAIAQYIGSDRLHETIYQSAAGPITAHDMIYGLGSAIARGSTSMAHRCGFTPTVMLETLKQLPFAEIILRRRRNLELAAIARKQADPADTATREALIAALEL